jgi:phosphorylcholine metabolism protein LicD
MISKFFNEKENYPHLDKRFASSISLNINRIEFLKKLLKNLVKIFNQVGIPCIIMHGTLIGWFWGKQILPWDNDIDLIILDEHREILKTLNNFQNNDILIEINPSIDRLNRDENNIIEARIICKNTGIFIDITNLSKGNIFHIGPSEKNYIIKRFEIFTDVGNGENIYFKIFNKYNETLDVRYKLISKNTIEIGVKRIDVNKGWSTDLYLRGFLLNGKALYSRNQINCQSPHFYELDDIYPLKKTLFEDISVFVPNNVPKVLIQEYGHKVLLPQYKDWIFNGKIWIKY